MSTGILESLQNTTPLSLPLSTSLALQCNIYNILHVYMYITLNELYISTFTVESQKGINFMNNDMS